MDCLDRQYLSLSQDWFDIVHCHSLDPRDTTLSEVYDVSVCLRDLDLFFIDIRRKQIQTCFSSLIEIVYLVFFISLSRLPHDNIHIQQS